MIWYFCKLIRKKIQFSPYIHVLFIKLVTHKHLFFFLSMLTVQGKANIRTETICYNSRLVVQKIHSFILKTRKIKTKNIAYVSVFLKIIKVKMKLFQTAQKRLELLGYIRNHHGYRIYPFSRRHSRKALVFLVSVISVIIFGIHIADSPWEYMDSFFAFNVTFLIFVSHMATSFKMTKLFDFLDKCENLYDKRKFYSIEIFKFTVIQFSFFTFKNNQNWNRILNRKKNLIKSIDW